MGQGVAFQRHELAQVIETIRGEMRHYYWYSRPDIPWTDAAVCPVDLTSERYVLSSMWEGTMAPPWLRAEHFVPKLHSDVFECLKARSKPLELANATEIQRAMYARGWPPGIDMAELLRSIEAWPCCPIEAPALIVVEMAVRRQAIQEITRVRHMLHLFEYEDLDGAAESLTKLAESLRKAALRAKRVPSRYGFRNTYATAKELAAIQGMAVASGKTDGWSVDERTMIEASNEAISDGPRALRTDVDPIEAAVSWADPAGNPTDGDRPPQAQQKAAPAQQR